MWGREEKHAIPVTGRESLMSTETDLAEALETAMGKTRVNWGDVRRLCEEIDRQRKQSEAVAKRLLGVKSPTTVEDLYKTLAKRTAETINTLIEMQMVNNDKT
jgi:hypothetical protein